MNADVHPAAIPASDPHPRRRVRVLDAEMSYVDVGEGRPIVFLHGNPTSSYLWRNVIPHVAGLGRCLAPDLVGMGRSSSSPSSRRSFFDHAEYLDAWFETLGLVRDVILVVHDWGSALGFHRAARHPEQVVGIAYMEAIVAPLRWDDYDADRAAVFRALRSARGEEMVLDQNFFVETVLPRGVIRKLADEEMEAYRAPFHDRQRRRQTLVWPRQLPIEGQPPEVVAAVEQYGRWLAAGTCPKLLVVAEPGALVTGRIRDICRAWPNQLERTVSGKHFVQEDSPHEVGRAIAELVGSVRG